MSFGGPSAVGSRMSGVFRLFLMVNACIAVAFIGLLLWGGSPFFGVFQIGIMVANLSFFAFLCAAENTGFGQQFLSVVTGLLGLATGLALPVSTSFGPALPSTFVTGGAMLLFAVSMEWLMARRGRPNLSAAWSVMRVAIVFAPLTVALGASVLLVLGWPVTDAIPGGGLGAFFVNPLIGYTVVIHGPRVQPH